MNFDEKSQLYPERGVGRSFSVTTTLEKAMIFITLITVIIIAGLIICLVSINKTSEDCRKELKREHEETCVTPACITEASNLVKSMDLNVDPCSDFYSFVCGNWIKEHHLVTSLETQFTQLTMVIFKRVKEILEDLEKEKNLPENKQKLSDFYKNCMDNAHRNVLGAKELLADLKELGGWPVIEGDSWDTDFDWAELMIQLFNKGYISNMLLSIRVDLDVKNTSRSLITVLEPSLGLEKREYYVLPLEKSLTSYKKVILKLAQLLKPGLDEERSMREIEEAFKIENRLAHLSKEENQIYNSNYYTKTLEKLEMETPNIPWRKLLRHLLPSGTELTSAEPIAFTNPSFFQGLNRLLEEMDNPEGKRALANYMLYRVVFFAANHLSKKFYSLVLNLLEPDKPTVPWQLCTKVTMELFPLPLTASYVDKYMTNGTKEQLELLIEDMRNSLMGSIKNSKWLDEETKNYALLKARNMKAAIAYEEEMMNNDNLDSYYKDVNITENHFGNVKQLIAFILRNVMEGLHEQRIRFKWTDVNNLLSANAYYRPNENSIIIPVGVLQDTFFEIGRPNYINYGSLGMIVGHELTHAFDSIGSLYDAEGSCRMWWSKDSWKKFEERMKCYKEQYSSYYMPEVDSNVNGTLTLSENIADNGGLKTAYNAYKALLKRIGSEKFLPGLPYNEMQMFWIAFASAWCRKQTDESVRYLLKHGVHTPSKFRVIGSLSNMKEFSEDFKCEINSTLNPTSRCYLWE